MHILTVCIYLNTFMHHVSTNDYVNVLVFVGEAFWKWMTPYNDTEALKFMTILGRNPGICCCLRSTREWIQDSRNYTGVTWCHQFSSCLSGCRRKMQLPQFQHFQSKTCAKVWTLGSCQKLIPSGYLALKTANCQAENTWEAKPKTRNSEVSKLGEEIEKRWLGEERWGEVSRGEERWGEPLDWQPWTLETSDCSMACTRPEKRRIFRFEHTGLSPSSLVTVELLIFLHLSWLCDILFLHMILTSSFSLLKSLLHQNSSQSSLALTLAPLHLHLRHRSLWQRSQGQICNVDTAITFSC